MDSQLVWQDSFNIGAVMALCLSLTVLPAMAAEPTGDTPFVNVSEDGGENVINLTQPRSFKAAVPVDMTEAEAKAAAMEKFCTYRSVLLLPYSTSSSMAA